MINALYEISKYAIFALSMFVMAKRVVFYYQENNLKLGGLWLTAFLTTFTLICAIRFNVGGDCLTYMKIFHNGWIFEDKEKLWNLLVTVFHQLGFHYVIGMGVIAFIQIYFITRGVRDFPFLLLTIPFVLFGGRYFLDLTGAIRQMTAACIFFWGSKFIFEKNFIKYVTVIIICSFIHHSSLMLIPIYFIPNRLSIANKRILMSVILIACFLLGQTPSFQGFIPIVQNITYIAGYSNRSEFITSYLNQGLTEEALTFGPMMLSYFLLAVILITYGPTLKRKYEKRIPLFNLWYNLAFTYSCAYFLICNVSHILIRPVLYLELFQLVTASLVLYDLFYAVETPIKKKYYCYAVIAVIWLNTSWDIIKNYNNPWNFTTYKTIFENKEKLDIILKN